MSISLNQIEDGFAFLEERYPFAVITCRVCEPDMRKLAQESRTVFLMSLDFALVEDARIKKIELAGKEIVLTDLTEHAGVTYYTPYFYVRTNDPDLPIPLSCWAYTGGNLERIRLPVFDKLLKALQDSLGLDKIVHQPLFHLK